MPPTCSVHVDYDKDTDFDWFNHYIQRLKFSWILMNGVLLLIRIWAYVYSPIQLNDLHDFICWLYFYYFEMKQLYM